MVAMLKNGLCNSLFSTTIWSRKCAVYGFFITSIESSICTVCTGSSCNFIVHKHIIHNNVIVTIRVSWYHKRKHRQSKSFWIR
uniref:Uncharacterized protein n=1 Tax=Hordeum vulgare subsp. vulgare TaxID=112509 RepID=A0A8I6Y3I1_HORVV